MEVALDLSSDRILNDERSSFVTVNDTTCIKSANLIIVYLATCFSYSQTDNRTKSWYMTSFCCWPDDVSATASHDQTNNRTRSWYRTSFCCWPDDVSATASHDQTNNRTGLPSVGLMMFQLQQAMIRPTTEQDFLLLA